MAFDRNSGGSEGIVESTTPQWARFQEGRARGQLIRSLEPQFSKKTAQAFASAKVSYADMAAVMQLTAERFVAQHPEKFAGSGPTAKAVEQLASFLRKNVCEAIKVDEQKAKFTITEDNYTLLPVTWGELYAFTFPTLAVQDVDVTATLQSTIRHLDFKGTGHHMSYNTDNFVTLPVNENPLYALAMQSRAIFYAMQQRLTKLDQTQHDATIKTIDPATLDQLVRLDEARALREQTPAPEVPHPRKGLFDLLGLTKFTAVESEPALVEPTVPQPFNIDDPHARSLLTNYRGVKERADTLRPIYQGAKDLADHVMQLGFETRKVSGSYRDALNGQSKTHRHVNLHQRGFVASRILMGHEVKAAVQADNQTEKAVEGAAFYATALESVVQLLAYVEPDSHAKDYRRMNDQLKQRTDACRGLGFAKGNA